MQATVHEIDRLYDGIEPKSSTLAVVNRRAPRQLQRILETLFERQPVRVIERQLSDGPTDTVQLIQEGEVLAASRLDELTETVLLVNSDRYITDDEMGGVDGFPAVLANMDEVPFTVRGYPNSHREKLLFIAISRLIEKQAAQATGGQLRASFQHVSRLATEPGTRSVYSQLRDRPVELHLYGYGTEPPERFDDVMALQDQWAHRHIWMVSFRNASEAAALFAAETEENMWSGYWTFDADKVDRINAWVDDHMQP